MLSPLRLIHHHENYSHHESSKKNELLVRAAAAWERRGRELLLVVALNIPPMGAYSGALHEGDIGAPWSGYDVGLRSLSRRGVRRWCPLRGASERLRVGDLRARPLRQCPLRSQRPGRRGHRRSRRATSPKNKNACGSPAMAMTAISCRASWRRARPIAGSGRPCRASAGRATRLGRASSSHTYCPVWRLHPSPPAPGASRRHLRRYQAEVHVSHGLRIPKALRLVDHREERARDDGPHARRGGEQARDWLGPRHLRQQVLDLRELAFDLDEHREQGCDEGSALRRPARSLGPCSRSFPSSTWEAKHPRRSPEPAYRRHKTAHASPPARLARSTARASRGARARICAPRARAPARRRALPPPRRERRSCALP